MKLTSCGGVAFLPLEGADISKIMCFNKKKNEERKKAAVGALTPTGTIVISLDWVFMFLPSCDM